MEGGETIGVLLSILLFILKWLGILFLAVLGLIILLILLICLVPIRYQIKGRVAEGVKARGDVTWLLHLIHVWLAAINAQILCKIKGLGFCLKKLHLGNWGEEAAERADAGREETSPSEKAPREVSAKQDKEKAKEDKKASAKQEKKAEAAPKKDKYDRLFEALEEEEKRKAREKEGPEAELSEESKARLKKNRHILRQVQDFWEDEKNREAVALIRRQFLKLGKHMLPTHFLLEGEIGLKDPAATGELVGKIYRFYPLYGDHIRLQGVFDRQTVNLYGELKGRFRLGILVEILIRLLLNKRCRSWARQMLKKDKDKGQKKGRKAKKKEAGPAVSG